MRVEQLLQDSARRIGARTAIVAGETRLSFAELDGMSDRLATALRARGIARHDRVAVFMDNSWQAVVSIFAVLKSGAVLTPINASTKADKLAFVLNNCRATAMITQARLGAVADAAVASVRSIRLVVLAGGRAPEADGRLAFEDALRTTGVPPAPSPAGIETDLAMLIYTSGTTGSPKGVMMTHRNVLAAATSINAYLENDEDDVILCVLPISHNYGLYQVITAVQAGACVVLEASFAFPQTVFQKMAEERVTAFPLVPTIAAIILQMKDLAPDQFPHLRTMSNAAAPLPPAHIERLRQLFPSVRFFSMYGQTECVRGTYLPPEMLAGRPGSVGIAIPNTEAYVADETGAKVGPGIVGELVIRGPHVMQGYWENPEATERALRPGVFPSEKVLHTGDFFRTDAGGFLHFVGRRDDIIKTRGEKVSPKEVESVLYALPGIREAAVIGVPDAILGMALKAVVALYPDTALTEKDVIRHCARNLEDFMVPKFVEFRGALPRSETGKIVRRLIEAEALEVA